jgi:hypothetical protein
VRSVLRPVLLRSRRGGADGSARWAIEGLVTPVSSTRLLQWTRVFVSASPMPRGMPRDGKRGPARHSGKGRGAEPTQLAWSRSSRRPRETSGPASTRDSESTTHSDELTKATAPSQSGSASGTTVARASQAKHAPHRAEKECKRSSMHSIRVSVQSVQSCICVVSRSCRTKYSEWSIVSLTPARSDPDAACGRV